MAELSLTPDTTNCRGPLINDSWSAYGFGTALFATRKIPSIVVRGRPTTAIMTVGSAGPSGVFFCWPFFFRRGGILMLAVSARNLLVAAWHRALKNTKNVSTPSAFAISSSEVLTLATAAAVASPCE